MARKLDIQKAKTLWPIASIEDVKWKTRMGELERMVGKRVVLRMVVAEHIPRELLDVPLGRLVYLAGEVKALTTVDYLESRNGDESVLKIAQEPNSPFYPVAPQYFKKAKR